MIELICPKCGKSWKNKTPDWHTLQAYPICKKCSENEPEPNKVINWLIDCVTKIIGYPLSYIVLAYILTLEFFERLWKKEN